MTAFERLGRLVHRHRRWVIAGWAVLLLVALPIAPRVASALRAGGFTLDSLESARARSLLERELGLPPSALVLVYTSSTDLAGTPTFEAAAGAAATAAGGAPHVTGILSHAMAPDQVSADRTTAYDVILLDLPPDHSPDALPGVRERLAALPAGPVEVALAGGPAFYGDIQSVSETDLRRSEIVSLPIAALALLVVFGSVVAAGLPLAVGGGAVLLALAVIWAVAQVTQMSIFVLNLATLLGLGLGVDYSLLMTSRFREELRRRAAAGGNDGSDPEARSAAIEVAVRVTVATAGRAVFFSGLTVLLGLTGLVLFEFPILRSVGIAGAIVVGLAVAAALTLLPAILSLLGDRVDAIRIRRVNDAQDTNGPWARLARRVMDQPVAVFIPTLAFLLVLGAPFLHVRFNAPDATILPPDVPSRAAFDHLDEQFGEGRFAPIYLAIRTTGPATSPANVAALFDYSRRLAADPRIEQVDGLVDVDPRLTKAQYLLLYQAPSGPPDRFVATALAATTRNDLTLFTLTTPYGPNADAARTLVGELRAANGRLAPPVGTSVLVGGGAADVVDVVDGIGAGFPRTALFIFVSTYLVLFVLLRSVVLPAKALVMNTLSIVAAFGALVWIFQDGNLSAILGFQPLGYVETTQPVILFCVLFGLSMDYEVFLLSRMKEVWDRTGEQHRGGRPGPRAERPDRHLGRPDRRRRGRLVRVRRHRADQGDRTRGGHLGRSRRHDRPGAPGPGDDAPAGRLELVDAGPPRALGRRAAAGLRGRDRGGAPMTRRPGRHRRSRGSPVVAAGLGLVLAIVVAGCSGPILAQPAAGRAAGPAAAPSRAPAVDPQPIRFPQDDGPHDRLTEWWYYTGHLVDQTGARYGFEFVIFRAERGRFPVTWASHIALTDEHGQAFHYAQRSEVGPQVDATATVSSGPNSFVLAISGSDPTQPTTDSTPWVMRGYEGTDRLTADLSPDEAAAAGSPGGLGLSLDLIATKPPDPARRRRLDRLRAGRRLVLLLEDGAGRLGQPDPGRPDARGPRVRLVRPPVGRLHLASALAAGTGSRSTWPTAPTSRSRSSGRPTARTRSSTGHWSIGTAVPGTWIARRSRSRSRVAGRSPRTGAEYPAGWVVEVPGERLTIELSPTVAAQELDTRATTGVVYWEGSQVVRASRAGIALGGEAYVELTGYGPP